MLKDVTRNGNTFGEQRHVNIYINILYTLSSMFQLIIEILLISYAIWLTERILGVIVVVIV